MDSQWACNVPKREVTSHDRTPSRLVEAQGQSDCSTPEAHPGPVDPGLACAGLTVVTVGLEAYGRGGG